ncbi:hypothetical protein Acife_2093 [Acidithiobacillus ferrivorans SS3]|jgi:hypothetical protein|uniref:Uncharacterized protein n=1 Tax=Acidithiobacillus ferrivorans SS3 TaxID=743299 RepID=G0JMS9_9PROT|nr:hypothetical protein Acife_2093 [Acidithiobacillus ferrivorans SS3]
MKCRIITVIRADAFGTILVALQADAVTVCCPTI